MASTWTLEHVGTIKKLNRRTVCFNFRWLTNLRHLFREESSYLMQSVLLFVLCCFSFRGTFGSDWSGFLRWFSFLLEAFGLMKWVLSLISLSSKVCRLCLFLFVSFLSLPLWLAVPWPHDNLEESSDKTKMKTAEFFLLLFCWNDFICAWSPVSSNNRMRFLVAI